MRLPKIKETKAKNIDGVHLIFPYIEILFLHDNNTHESILEACGWDINPSRGYKIARAGIEGARK